MLKCSEAATQTSERWFSVGSCRRLQERIWSFQAQLAKKKRRPYAHALSVGYRGIPALPEREKLIVQHCIRKASAKTAQGMRYTKEWIYDALLRIKSTTTYAFLQENGYLPLPSLRTIHDYLKDVQAEFGFEKNLFELLHGKLEGVPHKERKGVLRKGVEQTVFWQKKTAQPDLEPAGV